jgi:hypothetical protein
MGVAGLIFEPHPPNFEDQYNIWRCSNDAKMINDFSTGFRFSKISVECSVHLCSCPCTNLPSLINIVFERPLIRTISVDFLLTLSPFFKST